MRWRKYRKEAVAWVIRGALSGLEGPPDVPDIEEPADLEEFFTAIRARFIGSTAGLADKLQRLVRREGEMVEETWQQFDVLATPMEGKEFTSEQLATLFANIIPSHLKKKFDDRCEIERERRAIHGEPELNRECTDNP